MDIKTRIFTMQKILKIVRERFPAKVANIEYYDVEWILENCKDDVISRDFSYLRKTYNIGTQYEWFALLAKYLGIKMESAVVHQYHGKVEDAIDAEGILGTVADDILLERYCVFSKGDIETAYNVFGNLIFPVIKLSKEDEERIARENGWLDIMKLSWFCHSPINGKPCGLCGPCDDAMNTGMDWRMPDDAKFRYKHKRIFNFFRRIKRKLVKTRKGA